MNINNFDQSNTGTNLELLAMRDYDLSSSDWRENFERTKDERLFVYTVFGQVEAPLNVLDCYDLSNCTRRDFRAFRSCFASLGHPGSP